MAYDPKCFELAEHFCPDGTSQQQKYIAQEIQDAAESALEFMPCKKCGEFECQCDKPVDN
jgi:hypothetical protein